jgi:hypothetical protein
MTYDEPSDDVLTVSTSMSRADRQRFLADLHVGVLHVAAGAGTLAVPIWYDYSPDVGVSVITSLTSRKGTAIGATGRYGLVAQEEHGGYRYVSVEGPVVESRPCGYERDLMPMAVRYLGPSAGGVYAEAWRDGGLGDQQVITMRPEQWFAADFTEQFAALGV